MSYGLINAGREGNKITPLIISRESGVYKIFDVIPLRIYIFRFSEYQNGNSVQKFKILNMKNEVLINSLPSNSNRYIYRNKDDKKVKIIFYFSNPNKNSFFVLNNINILPINYPKPIAITPSIINKFSLPTKSILKIPNRNLESKPIISDRKILSLGIKINNQSIDSTISVIIPCHYLHFHHIRTLLDLYEKQSVLPNEIIIVLSESGQINSEEIEKIKNLKYRFGLKLLEVKEKSPAGNNRYLGSVEAEGSILIFQDADDIPHTQRVEIISYYMKKYPEVMHLIHNYETEDQLYQQRRYSLISITHKVMKENIFNVKEIEKRHRLTHGNISIRKTIVDQIDWDRTSWRAQDKNLNRRIFRKYGKVLYIRDPLYYYRKRFSLVKKMIQLQKMK